VRAMKAYRRARRNGNSHLTAMNDAPAEAHAPRVADGNAGRMIQGSTGIRARSARMRNAGLRRKMR